MSEFTIPPGAPEMAPRAPNASHPGPEGPLTLTTVLIALQQIMEAEVEQYVEDQRHDRGPETEGEDYAADGAEATASTWLLRIRTYEHGSAESFARTYGLRAEALRAMLKGLAPVSDKVQTLLRTWETP